jgi:Flp pilus assembly protein TadG
MLRRLRTLLRDTTGNNVIEAAIATPLLFLVFFCIIDFGYMFYYFLTLENGVSQATRYAITGNAMNDPDTGEALPREEAIVAALQNAIPTIDVNQLNITFSHMSPGSDTWTGGAGGPGDIGRVSVDYTWAPLTPLLRPFLTNGQMTVHAESAMKNESKWTE